MRGNQKFIHQTENQFLNLFRNVNVAQRERRCTPFSLHTMGLSLSYTSLSTYYYLLKYIVCLRLLIELIMSSWFCTRLAPNLNNVNKPIELLQSCLNFSSFKHETMSTTEGVSDFNLLVTCTTESETRKDNSVLQEMKNCEMQKFHIILPFASWVPTIFV